MKLKIKTIVEAHALKKINTKHLRTVYFIRFIVSHDKIYGNWTYSRFHGFTHCCFNKIISTVKKHWIVDGISHRTDGPAILDIFMEESDVKNSLIAHGTFYIKGKKVE